MAAGKDTDGAGNLKQGAGFQLRLVCLETASDFVQDTLYVVKEPADLIKEFAGCCAGTW